MYTGVTDQVINQTIPNCADTCPLDEFLESMRDVTPADDELYCFGREEDIARLMMNSASTSVNRALALASTSLAILLLLHLTVLSH